MRFCYTRNVHALIKHTLRMSSCVHDFCVYIFFFEKIVCTSFMHVFIVYRLENILKVLFDRSLIYYLINITTFEIYHIL